MANITSIESLDNTLANLKLLALKLDKDIASTIDYLQQFQKAYHFVNDVNLNGHIEFAIDELNAEEYELNRHDVELGDNGEW